MNKELLHPELGTIEPKPTNFHADADMVWPLPQASSEIREADDAFVTGYEQGFVHAIAEAVEAAEKSDAVGVVESVVRNRIVERVRALAPSRQGAAKRVEG